MVDKKTIHGTAEVWTEADWPGRVFYRRLGGGCVREVDLARFQFKGPEEAAKLIIKILDDAGWDSLILANLIPTERHDGTGS